MEHTRNPYCTGRHANLDEGGYESEEDVNKKPFTYTDECVAVEVTKVQEKPASVEVRFSNQSAQHHASSKTWADVAGFVVSKEKRDEDLRFVFKIIIGGSSLETRTSELWELPNTNALNAETCKKELFEWARNQNMLTVDDSIK